MQVIMMNYSGNVGKSTLCRHLLQPRMKGADFYTVETVNADDFSDEEVERLRGKQLGTIMPKLLGGGASAGKDVIVDVGSSNAEAFVQRFASYAHAHEFIDFFVIPTTSSPKQLTDTFFTIDTLANIGVPAEKIRLLLNNADPELAAEDEYPKLFKYQRDKKNCVLNPAARITHNELFTMMNGTTITIPELLACSIAEFKEKIKNTKDAKQRAAIAQQLAARLLAETAATELDAVFAALFQ